MAYVTAQTGDRGQLLLAAALGFGVLLVVLALILNSAIFTEALGSPNDSLYDERGALGYHDSVDREVSGIIRRVNTLDNSSYDALNVNLSESIVVWSTSYDRHAALDGTSTNTTLLSVTNGTRIVHDNSSRQFTNRSQATTWSPAENVTSLRGYRMYIEADTLHEPDNETCDVSSDCYSVAIDNGSAVWRMYLYAPNDSTGISALIETTSGELHECHTSNESAWVNLTDGTLDGNSCAHLSFTENITGPYTITYENADKVSGRYELAVGDRLSPTPHYDDTNSPRIVPMIYDAEVSVTYRSADLVYTTELRVIPDEADT